MAATATEPSAPVSCDRHESGEGTSVRRGVVALPPPILIRATDGVGIAISVYRPARKVRARAALVFYHGVGAHSRAGYGLLGRRLAAEHDVAVYLPDLRGHGCSGGPRGDAPCPEQVLEDISSVVRYARAREGVPVFLGGHSSGGGLVVNYATWSHRIRPSPAGYVLVAPQLGHGSRTARPRSRERPRDRERGTKFSRVSILPFILNYILNCDLFGHSEAACFDYPPSAIEEYGMVNCITVNVANAITPYAPREQVGAIKRPVGLWIGSNDELFVPERAVEYLNLVPAEVHGEIVEEANHLGILVHECMISSVGRWLSHLVE